MSPAGWLFSLATPRLIVSRMQTEEKLGVFREILLKLPTRDVSRCRCVSRLWRDVVADPTFRKLHAEAEVAAKVPVASEALLVMETREDCKPDEASFFCVSSSKTTPMPHRVVIPSGYGLSSVCNGLLCFALDSATEVPAFVCNPLTGETAILPKVSSAWLPDDPNIYHQFALGFSPSTKEYKLFRFFTSPPDPEGGCLSEIEQACAR
ncbi:F-box protein At5g65850-like [Aegilops tauschii subsp. strangulata]|uniref:F-box protein At5g65850-like n=1 Tax=Aegilops tauschii subsp. strangulata TaxID=200361 RepID=UPI00098A9F2B|nr:F-box protein At5g65850-like [Aegilops tauschii subsp. strangulata]